MSCPYQMKVLYLDGCACCRLLACLRWRQESKPRDIGALAGRTGAGSWRHLNDQLSMGLVSLSERRDLIVEALMMCTGDDRGLANIKREALRIAAPRPNSQSNHARRPMRKEWPSTVQIQILVLSGKRLHCLVRKSIGLPQRFAG